MQTDTRHPQVTITDTIRLHVWHFLPLFARGLFLPKRWVYRLLTRLPVYSRGRYLITKLRAKYESDHLYVCLLRTKPNFLPALSRTLLIYDEESIRKVFDKPEVFGADPEVFGVDPTVKQERIGLFQPGSLVMSSGPDANPKWDLNHRVLETENKTHGHGASFLSLIRSEVRNMLADAAEKLVWDQFAKLSERVSLQVILGQDNLDRELYPQLEKMIATSSSVFFPRRSSKFETFYKSLRGHLDRNGSASLTGHWKARFGDSEEPSWAMYQVTHWMFAMKDSLETHSARALALISAHPEVERDVRSEIQQALGEGGSLDPDGVSSLRLLEGCVNEAIRLWTPIPLLLRRTYTPTELGGEMIAEGCDVLIDGGYNHRDHARYGPVADMFSPRIWVEQPPVPPMNHFSNGARECAGKNLGIFLIKAIVAELLLADRFVLEAPRLVTGAPVPLAFDHYAVRFSRAPLHGADSV